MVVARPASFRIPATLFVLFISISTLAKPLDPLSPVEAELRAMELQQAPWVAKSTEKEDGWQGSCRKSVVHIEVGDPINSMTRAQTLTVIRQAESAVPSPVMILIPTIEGVTPVESSIVSRFCEAGLATIIADVNDNTPPETIPSWGIEDKRNRYSILAIRTAIDFAAANPNFDPSKVGIMGLSLGGIMTSFIAGLEASRLAAIVTVVSGGNFPFILSTTDNSRLRQLRSDRMQHEGMTSVDEYESRLRELRYDPMHFAHRAQPEKMFMVLSTNDKTVPSQMQQELWAAFRNPKNSVYTLSHVNTVVALTYWYFDTVTDFLADRFGTKRPPSQRNPKPPPPNSAPTSMPTSIR